MVLSTTVNYVWCIFSLKGRIFCYEVCFSKYINWVSFSESVQSGTYDIYIGIHLYSYVPIVHSGKN